MGVMEKKMETLGPCKGLYRGLYRDNGFRDLGLGFRVQA